MGPIKILVVDDEMDMRIYYTTLLKSAGYQPIATRDGVEGYQLARELFPDAIVLDIMMPGDGGVKMYTALKRDPELDKTPVIMASAVSEKSFQHYLAMLAARIGQPIQAPSAYLEKPIEPEILLSTLSKILNVRSDST
ncbi:response regulator [Desulfatirhabdium butyrativorans]|uniref:response regulator n=1 Tax=Desulfatirhabdium butyrativorans TaxID=340467 RepID=UPI000426E0B0|nr:response regulator [Desulfatirhabdium butyrativorans]